MPKKKQTEEIIEEESQEEKIEDSKKEKVKKLSEKEYEKRVLELAEKGLTSEKIGEVLKKENIHSNDYDKKISKILGDKYINPDLKNVEDKLKRIISHTEKNKQDKRAKREKDRVFSQVRKIKKHLNLI